VNSKSLTSQLPIRITDCMHNFAGTTPSAEAVIFGNQRIKYAELEILVCRFARALLAAGIKKGDRIAMLCTPRPEFYIAFLASAGIGAIWVGLNPNYRYEELCHVISDAKPKLIISLAVFEGRSYIDDLSRLQGEFSDVEQFIGIGQQKGILRAYKDFLATGDRISLDAYEIAASLVAPNDPAVIVYTSGSTGKPKGAVLSHYGLVFGSLMQAEHFGIVTPAVACCFPINHVACLGDTCATTLVRGGKIVFQERFDPQNTLTIIRDEQLNIWGGVPTMLEMCLRHPTLDYADLSSLELIVWGGAAMPLESVERLNSLGVRLLTTYGLTETTSNVTFTAPDAGLDVLAASIGRPDSHCACRIIDDNGSESGLGQHGELQFKADFMMSGYWQKPQETNHSFSVDGWLKTGDIGFWREDGNISLVGRRSDMFKSGGYNVYPREIEIALESHEDVVLAAVVSAPDSIYQEVGHAFVMLEEGSKVDSEDLRLHCRRRMANYKVPKSIAILEALPILPVGKVDKSALSDMIV